MSGTSTPFFSLLLLVACLSPLSSLLLDLSAPFQWGASPPRRLRRGLFRAVPAETLGAIEAWGNGSGAPCSCVTARSRASPFVQFDVFVTGFAGVVRTNWDQMIRRACQAYLPFV